MEFVELNINPFNRKTGDCVIRAIACLEGRLWTYVLYDMTCRLAPMGEVFDESAGFNWYLTEVCGYTRFPKPRKPDGRLYALEELPSIIDVPANGKVRVAVELKGHLTAVSIIAAQNGEKHSFVIDTWDCRERKVLNYWVKEVSE